MEKRLQSLKLSRDLTLGGTKPKKTFTPNLNVVRNKEKNRDFFIKSEDKRKNNNRKDIKNVKTIRRNFEKPERFVQSSGIFSDGVGTDMIRKGRFERTYSARDELSNAMAVPKVKKAEWQVDNKNETKVYDDIMGCEPLIDDNDEKLPFAPVSWDETNLKEIKVPSSNFKPEVKSEPNMSINLGLDRLKYEKQAIPREFQDSDQFSDNNPGVTLWNLPDSFSGKGLSDNPNVQTLFDYKLDEMLEGQIGKMRFYKSGKIEVCIGFVKYQVEAAQLDGCSEKIVALDTPEQKSAGIVLGQVQSRYILNPDWSYLLKDL